MNCVEASPGAFHLQGEYGPVHDSREEIVAAATVNHDRLVENRDIVFEDTREPRETSALVKQVADRLGRNLSIEPSFLLERTTVLAAYLTPDSPAP